MYTNRRLLAIETETTPGTAESSLAADAAINVFDLKMDPEVPFEERPGQAGFSHLAQVPGARMGRANFRTQLIGGASIPFWAAQLFPACRWVETSRIFSPVSSPPGTGGVKTVTLSSYEDGLLKKLSGCMGNAKFEFIAGRIVNVNWTFMGKWSAAPSDVALLAPTYPSESANLLRFANAGLTVGSWTPKLSRLSLDLGNQLTMVENANHADGTGYECCQATAGRVNGTLDPEATLVATNPLYTDWLSVAESALAFGLGTGTNFGVLFAAPKFQAIKVAGGDRGGVAVDNVEFQCNRSASAGNDELTIEFDTA